MGYVSWFCVEAIAFELLVDEGGSFLRLVERSRWLVHVVLLGKWSAFSLKNTVESFCLWLVSQRY
jgi:hypothetical protein